MKCPYCKYQDIFWKGNTDEYVRGEKGDFFKLPVKAERDSPWSYQQQHREVYGCPCCGKMFMEL